MSASIEFDPAPLLWFARRADPSRALEVSWSPPSWSLGRAELKGLFGLDRPTNFLRHHRGLLPNLWERQITQALRLLLLEVPGLTLHRCQALADALHGRRVLELGGVDRITADATDRMDLAIHCRDVSGLSQCIVIEAKLDSRLSRGQLAGYRRRLVADYPDRDQRHLWVVASRRTAHTSEALSRPGNLEWRFVTWRRLLLDWQARLGDNPGHDVLSLFAEIWKRSGGR